MPCGRPGPVLALCVTMTRGHRLISGAVLTCATLGLVIGPAPATGQQAVTVTIGATVRPATSLRLSASSLHVDAAPDPGPVVIGTIAFEAAARTRSAGDVVLTVESLRSIDDLAGGAAAGTVSIEFSGDGTGTVPGVLTTEAEVAARWVGSGVRRGTLTFTLQSPGGVTGGTLPLRFALAMP